MSSANFQFASKVAMVTGAGTGIGADTAILLAMRGASIALVGRRIEPLERVAQRITNSGGQAFAIAADVSKLQDMEKAVEATVKHFGRLHYAVNNAGVAGENCDLPELSVEMWESTIAINLSSLFHGLRVQLPAIESFGGGAIVNVSSVFADRSLPLRAAYTSSKHAVRGLTRSTAIDWAPRGVRINEIQPGVIDTPMAASSPEETDQIKQKIAAKRLGLGSEVGAAIAFLLSDDASYIVGAHLAVDGGFLA